MELPNEVHFVKNCNCGGKYQLRGKSSEASHNRSKRHQRYLEDFANRLLENNIHGSPFDRGMFDVNHSRIYNPHKIIDGETVLDLTNREVAEYNMGGNVAIKQMFAH